MLEAYKESQHPDLVTFVPFILDLYTQVPGLVSSDNCPISYNASIFLTTLSVWVAYNVKDFQSDIITRGQALPFFLRYPSTKSMKDVSS